MDFWFIMQAYWLIYTDKILTSKLTKLIWKILFSITESILNTLICTSKTHFYEVNMLTIAAWYSENMEIEE